MDSLRILSFNVNGLNDYHKRKDVFDYIRKQNAHIYFLQETHLKTQIQNYVRSMWGYNCILSGKDTNSKGVGILFNNNFEYKLHKVVKDSEGCYIILDIEMLGKRYTLVNIYGPSGHDSPGFFENLFIEVDTFENENIVIGGDWNVPLNISKDTFRYRVISRPRARRILCEIMERHNLVDVWRAFNPDKKEFTWRRFNSFQQGRLDYFLVSENLMLNIKDVNIVPGYRSDHNIITLELRKPTFQEKPSSYWKFNNSLLKEVNYVSIVKSCIFDVKKQYSLLVYDQENLGSIPNSELQLQISDQLFFEMLLLEIRGKSISYAAHRNKERKKEEENLIKEIADMEKNLQEKDIQILETKKESLQSLRKSFIDGSIIRSRAKWIQEGEKCTKYFCNLEKRNYVDKTFNYIETEEGEIINEPNKIKTQVKSFYENLYKSKEPDIVDVDLTSINSLQEAPRLSEQESIAIEGEISLKEALESLKKMENNKSPGSDGYTAEFYKFFWNDIGVFLVRSINEGFLNGQMSVTQRRGIITCIPKEGKEKQFLKNWRPITLLNTAYKIASACIAQRLKSVLPTIISENQSGFLPGRYIGENIRLVHDMLVHTESHDIPGLLLLVDYEKAFDSIAWSFIKKAMDFFAFGPTIKKWIEVFYNNISACVGVNRNYTSWFNIERGVRQGDPCSPYIYLICAEILSLLIRNNDGIKGVKISNDIEILLSQFADDTSLFLDGTKESFEACLKCLHFFSSISGLVMNYDKTKVVWIGAKKNSTTRFKPELRFEWNPDVFKVLGVSFSTQTDEIVKLNYDNKLRHIQHLLATWSKRNLTPLGKVIIIKTLAMSKLTHLFGNIPDPSPGFIRELSKTFYTFLWDGKNSKLSKTYVCGNYKEGGIRMLDVPSFLSALKIGWIKRVMFSDSVLKRFLLCSCPEFENLERYGSEYVNIILKKCTNPFWIDVIKHYKKLYIKCKPENGREFYGESIHYNVNIIRDKKTLHLTEWIDRGIFTLGQLVDGRGNFMSFETFQQTFPGVTTNILLYLGIIEAIKKYKLKTRLEFSIEDSHLGYSKVWSFLKYGRTNLFNSLLIKVTQPPCINKWKEIFVNSTLNWEKIFVKPFKTTLDNQLRWFQLRVLHRRIPTKRFLYLCKISDTPLCPFCNNQEETLIHMLWSCPLSQSFWSDLTTLIKNNCEHAVNFVCNETLVIFGMTNRILTDTVIDLILLLAKFYLYKSKLLNVAPNVKVFMKSLKNRYSIEKYRHAIRGQKESTTFHKNWLPYQAFLETTNK